MATPDWLHQLDLFIWSNRGTIKNLVLIGIGAFVKEVGQFAWWKIKRRLESPVLTLRKTVYSELSRNITQLQNIVDIYNQSPDMRLIFHSQIRQVMANSRYQAAKS